MIERHDIFLRWDMYSRTVSINIRGNSNEHGILAERLRVHLKTKYPLGMSMTPKTFRQMESEADMFMAEYVHRYGLTISPWEDRYHGTLDHIEINGHA